jgi:hypothetical protein
LSLVYSSSSSQISSSSSNFEKVFEAIFKNDKDCKETLKRYNFRKPKKEASTSEQVSPISISDYKKEK